MQDVSAAEPEGPYVSNAASALRLRAGVARKDSELEALEVPPGREEQNAGPGKAPSVPHPPPALTAR